MKEMGADFQEVLGRYMAGDGTVSEVSAAAEKEAEAGIFSYISFRKKELADDADHDRRVKMTKFLSYLFHWFHTS